MTKKGKRLALAIGLALLAGAAYLIIHSQFASPREVHFRTEDGVELAATFFPARSPVKSTPGILLLPMMGYERSYHRKFAHYLQEQGFAVLTVDLRGMGDSTPVIQKASDSGEWIRKFPLDVRAAVNYLASQVGVRSDRLAVMGADVTANAAIMGVNNDPRVKTLILLSGGYSEQAKAIVAREDAPPLLILASFNEGYPAYAARELGQLSSNPQTKVKIFLNAGHGWDMLRSSEAEEVVRVIMDWLQEHLKG